MTQGQPSGADSGPAGRAPRPDASGLLAKFLGASARENGPFGVLGLRAGPTDEDAVLVALRSRLHQTAAHAEGFTPEADEVRLAIHAAAAQLLDPATRRAMVERWGDGTEHQAPGGLEPPIPRAQPRSVGASPVVTDSRMAGAAADPVAAPRLSASDRDLLLLQNEAMRAIASSGGWNERARAHLQMFAAGRGIPPATLMEALSNLDRAPAALPAANVFGSGVARAEPRLASAVFEADAGRKRMPPALLWSLVVVGVAIIVIIGSVAIVSQVARQKRATPAPPAPAPEAVAARDTSTQAFPWKPETSRPAPTVSAPATTDVQRWVQELTTSLDLASQGEEGAFASMLRLIDLGAARWTELAAPDLVVVQRVIVDALYLAEDEAEAQGIIRAITGSMGPAGSNTGTGLTAAGVLRRVWAAGVLSRASRERDLPSATLNGLDRALSDLLGRERPAGEPPFESGAIAALRASLEACASSGEAAVWDAWIRAASAVGTLQPARRTDLLLGGLTKACETVGSAEEPVSRASARAIATLVPLIPWQREAAAQRWLLGQFDAFDTRAEALAALTRELSTRSSVPGVDATMVLAVPFSELERRGLRDRYARLFGIDDEAAREAVDAAWASAMDAVRERESGPLSLVDSLDVAVAWSGLSEAAWLYWRGAPDRATEVLTRLGAASAPVAASARGSDVLRREEPPEWTRSYLEVGADINRRVTLLASFPSGDPHPADAEVVIGEALRGSPVQVRDAARNVVRSRSHTPAMVNALLEALPTAPRTVSTADLIAWMSDLDRLPLDATDWRATARRAVVERLLGVLAARGELAMLDTLSERLAESHDARASAPADSEASEGREIPSLAESLAREHRAWRVACEDLPRPRAYPDSIGSIESDLAACLRVAEGPIQQAVAQTHAVVRLMAMAIASERSSEIERVVGIVERVDGEIAGARSVFDQIRAAERAMAELWEIRLGGREAP